VPGDPRHGLVENDWPVFAGGPFPARYVGDPIALVVAETAEIAQQALALIRVDYAVLPAVTDPRDALQPDAPQLHPDRPNGNLLKHIKVRHGDVEKGFAKSDVIVERTYRTPMTEHAFLEPECALAVPAGYSRAYASLGEKVMTRATTHATGPYVMPHARIDCYAMYTNNAPSGAMRQQMQNVLAEKFDTHPEVIAFHEGLAYVDERRLAQMHGAELPVEGANGSAGGILPGSTRSISFADAVNALLAENRLPKIRYEYWAPQTQPLGTGGDMHFAFSYAVHAALVSVDTETGEVAVERGISAHDVGRAINPLSLLG